MKIEQEENLALNFVLLSYKMVYYTIVHRMKECVFSYLVLSSLCIYYFNLERNKFIRNIHSLCKKFISLYTLRKINKLK